MINKKILAGILAASLATVPLITTYASMPDIEDVKLRIRRRKRRGSSEGR